MFKTKLLAGVLLVFMLLTAQVGMAAAAPLAQDAPPITGAIQGITTETDANGVTTVLVTLLLEDQTTQTVRISLAYAVELGLINPTTQEPVPLEELTEDVTIDANQVIPDEEPAEESVHPIAALLAAFFDEDPSIVDGYHEDGFGFGVIAQALWMSRNLTGTEDETGDASLAEQILQAKEDHDYSAFTDFFEDGFVPTNWGQFRKEVLQKKNNLGVIVSGQADSETDEQLQDGQVQDAQVQEKNGNGHGKDKNNGKGKGKKNK
jgi:hypothetical protein